jgi:predicted aspartyl protease
LQALTTKYNDITRILQSQVHVSIAFDPSTHPKPINPQNCGAKEFVAIWDTGATGTAVSKKVIEECGLKQIGVVEVHTANEKRLSPVYLASIFLPNHVLFPSLRVNEATIKDADVLIGMDIITKGDFAVTNKEGKTVFSFRMPSVECIDFVNQQPAKIEVGGKNLNKVGRNDLCPCGSGKKYKKCHGK